MPSPSQSGRRISSVKIPQSGKQWRHNSKARTENSSSASRESRIRELSENVEFSNDVKTFQKAKLLPEPSCDEIYSKQGI
ncbi:hypothetical protein CDAR_591021 [Caerostris darwini]|uniref:Uncharacterized protein n=1 Tax=Caerostris darwini TaxID=1538125 RepID=A0AAV4RP07_9ARAC|nr:hypothetical protein CDAR_591021 [Caerostris darwini]